MFRVILALLLLSTSANAAEGTFFKYMVSATGKPSTQKGLALGYQSEFSILETKLEGGFWTDQSGRPGAKGSAYGSASIGIEPTAGALYVNFFQGIAGITGKDTVLGGPVQFVEDLGIGIRDQKTKTSIGLHYKHMSSAGIFKPNLGRDFIGIQVMLPW